MAEEDKKILQEFGVSQAAIWALSGEEIETEAALQGTQGIATWDEMRRTDHNAAAIIAGLTLPIRRASWTVEPTSEEDIDQEAAEFLEQAMEDMSVSWSSMIVDALTFFPFGWAFLEQVMKRRDGPNPAGKDAAASKYSDGRIGWRKITLRPQTSLAYWVIDESGGIQGLAQTVPKQQEPVRIPIQRALLFRTTTEGNYPEGVSIFRPSWRPWLHRKRLEMVEGMALTRNLAGILKVTLGPGASTIQDSGQESDEGKARQLIKDAYNDRLVGAVETEAVKIGILEGPKGTDFDALTAAITRKDHEMARATLAHFIVLALQERGSYSLAKDESDLFLMAVMAYLDAMTDVIQRFAVDRLFRLNIFPGLTAIPQIRASAVYKPDIGAVATAVNDLAQAQVLTIDDSLEAYIRSVAGFPELPVDMTRAEQAKKKEAIPTRKTPSWGEEDITESIPDEDLETVLESMANYLPRRQAGDPLAGPPPRLGKKARTYRDSTKQYEADLQQIYREWAAEAGDLDVGPDTTEVDLGDKLDDYLGVGLLLLMEKGYQDLLAAYLLGFGAPSIGPEGLKLIESAQQKNDTYLAGSLFKDIRGKLDGEIAAILLLLKQGREDDAFQLIERTILTLDYRLPYYGGTYWEMIHEGIGMRITERGTVIGPPVLRYLDPLARHCTTCPPKAKQYPSWEAMVAEAGIPGDGSDECDGNCRCGFMILSQGAWIWP